MMTPLAKKLTGSFDQAWSGFTVEDEEIIQAGRVSHHDDAIARELMERNTVIDWLSKYCGGRSSFPMKLPQSASKPRDGLFNGTFHLKAISKARTITPRSGIYAVSQVRDQPLSGGQYEPRVHYQGGVGAYRFDSLAAIPTGARVVKPRPVKRGSPSGSTVRYLRYILRSSAQADDTTAQLGCSIGLDPEAWRAIEHHEASNGRIQMRIIISLPCEMSISTADHADLIRNFAQSHFEAHRLPWAAAIHRADANGDARNIHAHICFHDRPMWRQADGSFRFAKTKAAHTRDRQYARELSDNFVTRVNALLTAHSATARWTNKSYAEREIVSTPSRHLGHRQMGMERRGKLSRIGTINRRIAAQTALNNDRVLTLQSSLSLLTEINTVAAGNHSAEAISDAIFSKARDEVMSTHRAIARHTVLSRVYASAAEQLSLMGLPKSEPRKPTVEAFTSQTNADIEQLALRFLALAQLSSRERERLMLKRKQLAERIAGRPDQGHERLASSIPLHAPDGGRNPVPAFMIHQIMEPPTMISTAALEHPSTSPPEKPKLEVKTTASAPASITSHMHSAKRLPPAPVVMFNRNRQNPYVDWRDMANMLKEAEFPIDTVTRAFIDWSEQKQSKIAKVIVDSELLANVNLTDEGIIIKRKLWLNEMEMLPHRLRSALDSFAEKSIFPINFQSLFHSKERMDETFKISKANGWGAVNANVVVSALTSWSLAIEKGQQILWEKSRPTTHDIGVKRGIELTQMLSIEPPLGHGLVRNPGTAGRQLISDLGQCAPWHLTAKQFAQFAKQEFRLLRSIATDGSHIAFVRGRDEPKTIFISATSTHMPARELIHALHCQILREATSGGLQLAPHVLASAFQEQTRTRRTATVVNQLSTHSYSPNTAIRLTRSFANLVACYDNLIMSACVMNDRSVIVLDKLTSALSRHELNHDSLPILGKEFHKQIICNIDKYWDKVREIYSCDNIDFQKLPTGVLFTFHDIMVKSYLLTCAANSRSKSDHFANHLKLVRMEIRRKFPIRQKNIKDTQHASTDRNVLGKRSLIKRDIGHDR
jgi:hypothetical protein